MKIDFDRLFLIVFPLVLVAIIVRNVNLIYNIKNGDAKTGQKSYATLKSEYNDLLRTRKRLVTQSENHFEAARSMRDNREGMEDIVRNKKRLVGENERFIIVRYVNDPERDRIKALGRREAVPSRNESRKKQNP